MDGPRKLIVDLFRESVAGRVAPLLGEREERSTPVAVHLAHHSPSGAHRLWAGFDAARLDILSRVARGEGCPAVLVFGVHARAVVLQHGAAAEVLSHPAIQYLRISQLEDVAALADTVTAAIAGTGAPMPAAFQRNSLEALRKALSGLAHCLQNVLPIVQAWADAVRRQDMGALPAEIPPFARWDQRETLQRLGVFEPLARALSDGAVSLEPIEKDWHALETTWEALQGPVGTGHVGEASRELQARLQAAQLALGQVTARIKRAQGGLRQVMGERTR